MSHVQVVGTGHSFNASAAADTQAPAATTDAVYLDALAAAAPPVIEDGGATVSVCGGSTYAALFAFLADTPYAVHNAASLPHISVGGSVATGTHGSGARNGSLATSVVRVELVTPSGEIRLIARGDPDFDGVVVNIGALGVVTRLWLMLVPSFQLRQDVFDGLPFDTALSNLPAIMSAGYSVSLFTTWRATPLVFEQVWRKSLPQELAPECGAGGEAPPTFYGAARATSARHPIAAVPPGPCTQQLGVVGPWHARLPHFRAEFTPSVGEELQAEYFVAAADAPAALAALALLAPRIAPLIHVTEIRAIAADSLWLSPAYHRDSIAIHFTWRALPGPVAALLPDIEAALAPYTPRPHWGKLFAAGPSAIAAAYPRHADFSALRARLDPTAKFANDFLRTAGVLGAA